MQIIFLLDHNVHQYYRMGFSECIVKLELDYHALLKSLEILKKESFLASPCLISSLSKSS